MKLLDNAGWEALADCEITPAGARFTIRLYNIEFGDNPFFGDHLEDQSWFEQLPEEGQKFTRIQRITRVQDDDPSPLALAPARCTRTVRRPGPLNSE